MQAWWDALDILGKAFALIAIPSTLILVIQTILMFIGMGNDGDADGADTDVDDAGDMDADADGDGGGERAADQRGDQQHDGKLSHCSILHLS